MHAICVARCVERGPGERPTIDDGPYGTLCNPMHLNIDIIIWRAIIHFVLSFFGEMESKCARGFDRQFLSGSAKNKQLIEKLLKRRFWLWIAFKCAQTNGVDGAHQFTWPLPSNVMMRMRYDNNRIQIIEVILMSPQSIPNANSSTFYVWLSSIEWQTDRKTAITGLWGNIGRLLQQHQQQLE